MKLALIREGKVPPDSRVPLTPEQCAYVLANHPVEIVVEPSPIRCFADDEYREAGIALQNDLSDADVLLGVKEVPVEQLIPGKTYFFFSHTIKKQAYNRRLLQTILEKRIRLIDYEVLTDLNGRRLIAFGRFAGMVGAHNALYTFGRRSGLFSGSTVFFSNNSSGVVTISGQVPAGDAGITGNGEIFVLEFRPAELGFTTVEVDEAELSDSFDNPIDAEPGDDVDVSVDSVTGATAGARDRFKR